MFGATRTEFYKRSERICVLEVDLNRMSPDDVPKNRTFRIQAQADGIIHAALFDWDIWAEQKEEVLSTAPGSRNFAGDVAWGWLLQLQELSDDDWHFHETPKQLRVQAGQWLEMAVEFIAHGVSMSVRLRPSNSNSVDGTVATFRSPSRILQPTRIAVKETNEFLLPVAGDIHRHDFYAAAIDHAVETLGMHSLTLLDCSSNAGLPGFYAASKGIRSVVMPRWNHVAEVLQQIVQEHGLNDTTEVVAGDPREMFDILLPQGKRVNIVVVDPPGTPMHGMSPFAILPAIRKELLQEDGLVVPSLACLEVALLESEELAHMFSIPKGRWGEVDLREWNREARRQGVLSRLVPYTKWLGSQSSLRFRWLSSPQCVYDMDLNAYARAPATKEETLDLELPVLDGLVHAIVARWAVFSGQNRLGAESSYLGRDLTWPQYVQAVGKPGMDPGLLEPLPVQRGLEKLQLVVRQGAAKVTGAAGPEFTLRLRAEPEPLSEAGHRTSSSAEL
ncbi:unnamed protein product [Cladocopium goreaui]|uniref:Uncharacterized protein n=1 Tax=Cladocopium goreaui TaxID=2562237 RepID=A0A9P1G6U8_9DINO|nr:unnamed protein product [Cladocopium goreaui]